MICIDCKCVSVDEKCVECKEKDKTCPRCGMNTMKDGGIYQFCGACDYEEIIVGVKT